MQHTLKQPQISQVFTTTKHAPKAGLAHEASININPSLSLKKPLASDPLTDMETAPSTKKSHAPPTKLDLGKRVVAPKPKASKKSVAAEKHAAGNKKREAKGESNSK